MPTRRILILDDHPATLELMRDIFLEERDEVIALATVSPDLTEISAARPDLAIVDLRLSTSASTLSGWDVVRLMKAHADLRDVHVLVISADAKELERHVEEAARLDGVQLLSKPFSLENLLAVVGEALRDRAGGQTATPSDAPAPAPPADGHPTR
jgi:CheY-like chemotaxis protein